MDQKLFILNDDVKNPRWELRNKGISIPKHKDGNLLGLREIQYVPNASSIWKEDNSKEGSPKSLWFTEGVLAVPASDLMQIEFITNHPEFNVKFHLHDPEAKSKAEFEELELVEKARDLLRESNGDEDKMAATAASLFGITALTWGAMQTKLMCYNHAAIKPQDVIDTLNDESAYAKYIAALGFRKGIVDTNPQKTAVVWNDKDRGVICHVPVGQKPLVILGQFLYDEEQMVTLQELGKRIDALSGIVKKPAAKKKAE
jgi:hypothetical protein